MAAEVDNPVWLYECLAADNAHIVSLDDACHKEYHRRLFKAKAAKIRVHTHIADAYSLRRPLLQQTTSEL